MRPRLLCLLALGFAPALLPAAADDTGMADDTQPALTGGSSKRCVQTDRIIGYVVESDETVRLQMKGRKDVMVQLRQHCPQLQYHNYIAFTPTNGELCARFDDIVTRTGLPCRITSLTEIARGAQASPQPQDQNPETEQDNSHP